MSNKFKTSILILSNQVVTATGDNIYINGNQVQGGVSHDDGINLSGNLQSTGSNLNDKIVLLNVATGYINTNPSGYIRSTQTGQFYPNSNPLSFSTSGNVQATGQSLQNQVNLITSTTGNFYLSANLQNYSTSGNVQNTGFALTARIDNLSGNLYSTGSNLNTKINALSGVISGSILSPWASLTCGVTTNWAAQQNIIEDRKILTLTGNSTLNITNLYNGWAGVLKTIQSPSGYNLTLPSGSKVINSGVGAISLSSGILSGIDVLGFEYDGANLLVGIGNNFN